MSHVLLPWRDVEPPPGVSFSVYDGTGPAPSDLDRVEFYVMPYDKGDEPATLISRMPGLRAVQSLSAGVEKLLPLIPHGVTLANGAGLHDASVAEHTMALVLAAQRDMPRWIRQQPEGSWAREHTRSLADADVLLLGYGAIGRAVDTALTACGARVTPVASRARDGVHGIDELPALLPGAEILVLVLPENQHTKGLIGSDELSLLPDDALVVNVGRGRTLDTAALVTETGDGRLRAALDVLDPEPLPRDHPLWTTEGVVITPHVAGGSASFRPRARRLAEAQLIRFARGEPLVNVVN